MRKIKSLFLIFFFLLCEGVWDALAYPPDNPVFGCSRTISPRGNLLTSVDVFTARGAEKFVLAPMQKKRGHLLEQSWTDINLPHDLKRGWRSFVTCSYGESNRDRRSKYRSQKITKEIPRKIKTCVATFEKYRHGNYILKDFVCYFDREYSFKNNFRFVSLTEEKK